jgi:hypothetical protein
VSATTLQPDQVEEELRRARAEAREQGLHGKLVVAIDLVAGHERTARLRVVKRIQLGKGKRGRR